MTTLERALKIIRYASEAQSAAKQILFSEQVDDRLDCIKDLAYAIRDDENAKKCESSESSTS